MPLTVIAVCAAAAAGYAAGRTRPGERLYNWAERHAYGPHGAAWWAAQSIGVVALAWFLLAHPRRSAANTRANRAYREAGARRSPAPAFDPNWAAHRPNTTPKEDDRP